VVSISNKGQSRISLGIKQLSEDPWKNIDQKYKSVILVKGKVTSWRLRVAFVIYSTKSMTRSYFPA